MIQEQQACSRSNQVLSVDDVAIKSPPPNSQGNLLDADAFCPGESFSKDHYFSGQRESLVTDIPATSGQLWACSDWNQGFRPPFMA